MKVADFIINYLAEKGIKDIFVVYGGANGDLIDAFTRTGKTRYVCVMHEQAGGFAAEAYAKIGGKFGVAIATSGPGGQNFVTPIANCFYDSTPCLFITGQVKTQFLRNDENLRQVGFQETDIVSIVKPITKYAKLVTDPLSIKYELEKALFLAKDKRPGPVLLDLPIDIQKAEIDETKLIGFDSDFFKDPYNIKVIDEKIDRFLKDLSNSKRPLILVGMGVRIAGAVDKLLELGEKLKIPMAPTWNATDIVTSDLPYYAGRIGTFGGKGRNLCIQNSDLLLALGSRISGRLTGSRLDSFARGAKKYVVDVDETLLQKKLQQIPFDENIFSDARLFLERLLLKLENIQIQDFSQWTDKVIEWRNKYDPVLPEYYEQNQPVNPYIFFRTLSKIMKEGDILVGDCGGNIIISNHAFETKKGQRAITNNGNSPMGYSFSASIGAYLASDRTKNIVCTIGDGGFNMNIQELQTIKNYNLKFKTFIINNHCYGITRAFQKINFQGRCEACGPKGYSPPDFLKIVEAYGVKTFSINSRDETEKKIKEVLEYDGPAVCDINCHDWDAYEPRIVGWETPLEDVTPLLPEDELRANMFIEPIPREDKRENDIH